MPRDYSSRQIIKRLRQDGWERVAQAGSHMQFKHPNKTGRITVAHPQKSLSIGQLRDIFRKAGWKW